MNFLKYQFFVTLNSCFLNFLLREFQIIDLHFIVTYKLFFGKYAVNSSIQMYYIFCCKD